MTSADFDAPAVRAFLQDYQDRLCARFGALDDGQDFQEDLWQRAEGGGGRSRILEAGAVFEKAGVGYSHVFGPSLPPAASQTRPELAGRSFEAAGVSVVIHPDNPYVPTSHANVRYFVARKDGEAPIWWFGGGFDLTPYYPFEEDAVDWHRRAKAACDPFGPDLYRQCKKACDEYFFLPHRGETRGVGGLFFDDYDAGGFEAAFAFLRSVAEAYGEAYGAVVEKRRSMPWGDREKAFQKMRRGRYVEFNLLYDRGTLFGLQSDGRTESILMSLPPQVAWHYDAKPEAGSEESLLYDRFLQAQDWLGLEEG